MPSLPRSAARTTKPAKEVRRERSQRTQPLLAEPGHRCAQSCGAGTLRRTGLSVSNAALSVARRRSVNSRSRHHCGRSASQRAPAPATGVRAAADIASANAAPSWNRAWPTTADQGAELTDPTHLRHSSFQIRSRQADLRVLCCTARRHCDYQLSPRCRGRYTAIPAKIVPSKLRRQKYQITANKAANSLASFQVDTR